MAQERHTAAFVVGIALGGLAGAGYVLFKTPRSGADLRADIAARVQGIVDAVKETAGIVGVETRRAGEQTVERIEATGAAVRDRLPGAAGVADLVPGLNRETPVAEPVAKPTLTEVADAAVWPAAEAADLPEAAISMPTGLGVDHDGAVDAETLGDDASSSTGSLGSRAAPGPPAQTAD